MVKEVNLTAHDGLIRGRRVAIRRSIETTAEKACVLAEEIGHYYTSTGDILDQEDVRSRQQERRAREYAYAIMVGLDGIIAAFEHGCRNRYETAQYLDVTERFLEDALDRYSSKCGKVAYYKGYQICFDPLEVARIR
jgi:Zn-dependent peptidase ImmA (M78 family)